MKMENRDVMVYYGGFYKGTITRMNKYESNTYDVADTFSL